MGAAAPTVALDPWFRIWKATAIWPEETQSLGDSIGSLVATLVLHWQAVEIIELPNLWKNWAPHMLMIWAVAG